MTTLRIYKDTQPDTPVRTLEDYDSIACELSRRGVRFERWDTHDLPAGATQEEVLAAYADDVQRLKDECGFATADVVSLTPAHPDKAAFRQKFLSEHRHIEDEVRFFVEGDGLFYLHLDSDVLVVHCTRGDLISVPDGTRHWFDMGPEPCFTCIRLFTQPEGWVADFTGDDIADRFPRYEALAG